jgi:hypothetical protein
MLMGVAFPSIWAASLITARAASLSHEAISHHGTWMSPWHPIAAFVILTMLGSAAFIHGWFRLNRVISN